MQVLSDQDKRNTYDATGHSEYTAGSQGASSGFTSSQAEEIFKSFFGGGGFGNMFEQGTSTHRIGLTLSFNESVSGCTKDISLRVQGTCGRCFGTGGEPGTKEQVCPYCRGKGEVSVLVYYRCAIIYPFYCVLDLLSEVLMMVFTCLPILTFVRSVL